jgi:hypothetical protein
LSSVSGDVAEPWMAGILLAIGVYILCRFTFSRFVLRPGRRYVRGRYLAPLGLAAGFVDAIGGGGWGPVATPTLLASGRMEPRKVIGSVDTSEFLVALSASAGFLVALGGQGIRWSIVVALLAGGLLAAPLAAWLVQKITARLLGTAVGGLIVVTNARTLFGVAETNASVRWPVYLTLAFAWALALARMVRAQRRDGEPCSTGRAGVFPPQAASAPSEHGANGTRTRDLLAASQTLSQLSYGPAVAKCSEAMTGAALGAMDDKTDYSPVDETVPKAQKRRERRVWAPFALGAWSFLIYAAVLAGIILLVIYLTGGFGEGAE